MKEHELSKPVAEWLRQKGYEVYSEVPFPYGGPRVIDIIGINQSKELILIELKKSATKEVFNQIASTTLITPEVYICTASKPKKTTIGKCKKYRCGLLYFNGKINVEVDPARDKPIEEHFRKRIIDRLNFMLPSDDAGKPNQKGCGPAIECAQRVRKYLQTNTVNSWKDVFENVGNHYSNWKSLRSVMTGKFHIHIIRKRMELPVKRIGLERQQLKLELI